MRSTVFSSVIVAISVPLRDWRSVPRRPRGERTRPARL
jgi:hypothetical protein